MKKMSKGLEALEKLTNYKCSRMSEKIECKEIIKKELKALEIIKAKINDIALFKSYCKYELGFEMWNYYHKGKELTEQEYNLLKEVLL